MRFAYVPRADYHIGQRLTVHGLPVEVESYTHTRGNVIVHTLPGAVKFERIVCICADDDDFIYSKEPS